MLQQCLCPEASLWRLRVSALHAHIAEHRGPVRTKGNPGILILETKNSISKNVIRMSAPHLFRS
eukprot:2942735-Amphidinium_carterae.1